MPPVATGKQKAPVSKTLSLNASRIAPPSRQSRPAAESAEERNQSERKKKRTEDARFNVSLSAPTTQQTGSFFNANFGMRRDLETAKNAVEGELSLRHFSLMIA